MVANEELTGQRRVLHRAVLIGVWLCGLAAADAEAAKRVALLIGNEQYQAHNVLANPKRDVELVAGHLRKLGFKVVAKANLRRAEMVEVIDQFIVDANGAEVALFYYAGHGMQPLDGGRNYLLPIDARRVTNDSVLRADGLPADGPDSVLQRLERAKTQLRLMLLDACRNNAKGRGIRSADRGLRPVMPENQFTLVSFSTRESSPALDDVKGSTNSPYATALAKWLPMAGHRSVRDIFESVGEQVKAETGGDQEPAVYTTLPGNIMLSGSMRERTEAENEADAWFYASQAGSVSALKAFLQEYPKGQYAAQARIRLAALQEPAPPPSSSPQIGQIIKDCNDCPELVVIPPGSFQMGSDSNDSEKPIHLVTIPRALTVGRTEVTVAQYLRCVAERGCDEPEWRQKGNTHHYQTGSEQQYRQLGAALTGDNHPIVGVSWNNAQQYVKWLSAKTSGNGYRLLTESEWEYAARAGSVAMYSFGDSELALSDSAWFSGNSGGKTQPVAQKKPNAFGLYDMHGNVWEWVEDVWHDNYTEAPTDGTAWTSGGDSSRRVLRGGSWSINLWILRSANRYRYAPDNRNINTGFRIARTF